MKRALKMPSSGVLAAKASSTELTDYVFGGFLGCGLAGKVF
jgi:hypothetical protein